MTEFIAFSDDTVSLVDDALGREALVDRIVQALDAARNNKQSSVLGLIGPWGSGKSSVLDMLRGKLKAQAGDWQWISFNPWYYGDTTSMQFGFFTELRSHMQAMNDGAAKDAVRNARDSFGSLMKSSAPFIGAIGGLVGVDASEAMKKLGDLIGGEESTTRALEQANAALRKLDMPFVVVLDDLDRLDPGELLLVARLVRLVGRLPNVHYLLAYDERTLIDLLRASPLVGKDSGRAEDYLEKIVQLRFDMPPLRGKQVDDLINAQLNETLERLDLIVDPLVLNRFQDIYDQALRGRFRTVRSIKRYFAQVGMVDPGVLRELDFSDYLLLTWLRVEEPSVYHWLPRNRAHVLNLGLEVAFAATDQAKIAKKRQAKLFSLLDSAGVAEEDRDSVVDVLIALFPLIRNDRDGAPRQANHFSSADGLRVNSSDYFDRYFALEVPPEDIANVAVAAGVEDLAAGNEDTAAAVRLRTAFLEDPALVRRKLEITPQNAAAVAEWMLDTGQDEEDPNRWIGSLARTVEQLLAIALATTPPEALEGLLIALSTNALRLPTLAQSCRDLLSTSNPPQGMSQDAFDEVTATVRTTMLPILADHFKEENRDPMDGGTDLWVMIWLWEALSDDDAPKAWIQSQVETGRWDLIRTVGALVPVGISSNGTRSIIDPISRGQLERFFDLPWLVERASALNLDPETTSSDDDAFSPGQHPVATEERLEATARAALRKLQAS